MDFLRNNRKLLAGAGLALLCQTAPSYAVNLSAQGFGSFYGARTTNNSFLPVGFESNQVDFTHFSLIGADLTAKIDDQWSVLTELIAQGQQGNSTDTSNFNNYVQWAFINYKPIDNMNVKLGRQRFPIWMASEFINTHHQLPFRVLPQIVYKNAPLNAFDGALVSYGFETGVGKLDVAVFGGDPIIDMNLGNTVSLDLSNLYGARAVLLGDGWRVRAMSAAITVSGSSTREITISNQTVTSVTDLSAKERITSFGYRFDKYDFVSWGEYSFISADGSTINPVPAGLLPEYPVGSPGGTFLKSTKSGYAVLGYRLGSILPRYTYAQVSSDIGFGERGAKSHTFGLDYFASEKVTVRGEYEIVNVEAYKAPHYMSMSSPETSTGAIYFGADFIL